MLVLGQLEVYLSRPCLLRVTSGSANQRKAVANTPEAASGKMPAMPNSYVKRLICLANSRKPGGRCVAGKEFINGKAQSWIRPVSSRPSGELLLIERSYGHGSCARIGEDVGVGHIFDISLLGTRPHAYQVENHIVDLSFRLGFRHEANWSHIESCLDNVAGPLWINGHSTRYGSNDQIPEELASQLGESLKFIQVDDFQIGKANEWPEYSDRTTLRGSFSLNKFGYAFKITDPVIEHHYATVTIGCYPIGRALLCISVSEPHKGNVYKLIAAVIRRD